MQQARQIRKQGRQAGATTVALCVFLGVVLAACNSASGAGSVMETNNVALRATIDYWESAAPTMTAQVATLIKDNDNLQLQLDQVEREVRELTVRLNSAVSGGSSGSVTNAGNSPIVTPLPPIQNSNGSGNTAPNVVPASNGAALTPDPNAASITSAPTAASGSTVGGAQSGADGTQLESIVLSGDVDRLNCAVNQVTTFNASAARIYAVARVGNFRSGAKFTTVWRGPNMDDQTFDWTSTYQSAGMECVPLYIEPSYFEMGAGQYSMTYSITGLEDVTISFTIQGEAETTVDESADPAATVE